MLGSRDPHSWDHMILTVDTGYQPPAQNYGGGGVQGYGQPPAAAGEHNKSLCNNPLSNYPLNNEWPQPFTVEAPVHDH